MGIDTAKSYSAKEIKTALQHIGFVVTKCEASKKHFLVQVSSGPGAVGTPDNHGVQGISCTLDGTKCAAGGLVGDHGLNGLSKSALHKQ